MPRARDRSQRLGDERGVAIRFLEARLKIRLTILVGRKVLGGIPPGEFDFRVFLHGSPDRFELVGWVERSETHRYLPKSPWVDQLRC
jgi:hypothetical protein